MPKRHGTAGRADPQRLSEPWLPTVSYGNSPLVLYLIYEPARNSETTPWWLGASDADRGLKDERNPARADFE